MPGIYSKIIGKDGHGAFHEAHVSTFNSHHGVHEGLNVLTHDFVQRDIGTLTFANDTVGANMAINAAAGGTPEILNNGGTSTEWTLSGTGTFAETTGKLVLTNGNNNDVAVLSEEGASTVDWGAFETLSGKVDLDTYNPAQHSLFIQFDLAGVLVGDQLDLNDYIDTGNFTEQSFSIPKANFNFSSTIVDGFTITVGRSGGTKPDVSFDDFQMEETGASAIFKITAAKGKIFQIQELRFSFTDVYTGVLTDSSTHRLFFDQLLSLGELTNGITLTRKHHGEISFSSSLRNLRDFCTLGTDIRNYVTDGTDSYINLVVEFPTPAIIDGTQSPDQNFVSLTIADNLSGLTQFVAVARGAYEI